MNIVFIAHYYPPLNSSGAKRVEALSKYIAAMGHSVTVITPRKTLADGEFTEETPVGVNLIELNAWGRDASSVADGARFEPMYIENPSKLRRFKDLVMRWFGQVPDPRLPFAFSFISPWLSERAKQALRQSHVVIGTSPPWPMLLAAILAKYRFRVPCILDYRDHFSECHEMPGNPFSRALERVLDRCLVMRADRIVAISDPMTKYYASIKGHATTIFNGYEPDLMDKARRAAQIPLTDDYITIRYMGVVSPGRVPHRFLNALVRLSEAAPDKFKRLRIEFYGNSALIVENLELLYPQIKNVFHFFSSVSYLISLQRIIEADYLLFAETSSMQTLSAQGILTTKLFEYIGSGRPIIADISPKTLAGSLLLRCGEIHLVSDTTENFYLQLNSKDFYSRKVDTFSELSTSFSRKAQALEYVQLAEAMRRSVPESSRASL